MRCHPATIDLRQAFSVALGLRSFMPADDDTGPSPADDEGEVDPADGAAGEGDEQEPVELDDDEGKNPRLKEVSDEAAKWRRKFRETTKRLADLESTKASDELQQENRSLKLELAWDRATRTVAWSENGAEGAWKMAQDQLPATLNEDGTVDGTRIGEVVNAVVKQYPFLIQQEPEEAPPADAFPQTHPSGPSTNGKVRQSSGTDLATLQRKFPALRSRH